MSEYFSYTGDNVLDVMSKYAVNRNNFIEKLIRKSFGIGKPGKDKKNLLELGAGRGEFIDRFADDTAVHTMVVEPDAKYLEVLGKRHEAYAELDQVSKPIDCVYAIDVMEHIENDAEILKSLYDKMPDKGRLLIYVPARMELYSQFDKNIGHFRRYHKKELRDKVKAAGFTIEQLTYHELLGYFAAFANKLSGSGDLNPKAVSVYDKVLVPLTNLLERFLYIPIGKSLYVVARKNGSV
jgi:hypothetical protein